MNMQAMKHNVYYGEYSLSHWIDLILSKNLILPEYQRIFVWDKKKVRAFLDSLKNNQFIPPITIGLFKEGGKDINYILDGQQRLTSIICALFDVFPKRGKALDELSLMMNENDDEMDSEELQSFISWRFDQLTSLGSSYDEIKGKIPVERYDAFEHSLSTGDFQNRYLGFTYIVPTVIDETEQQHFYANVFRNINYRGERLTDRESRESLYFLNKTLTPFFKADIGDFMVVLPASKASLDFTRFVALLFQYHRDHSSDNIAAGFGSKKRIEEYYENFIASIIEERDSDTFAKFVEIFPELKYEERIKKLKEQLQILKLPREYKSIITIDVYLFGAIYYILLLDKNIDFDKKSDLLSELSKASDEFINVPTHKKSPAALKYLRERIKSSIEIYGKYVKA